MRVKFRANCDPNANMSLSGRVLSGGTISIKFGLTIGSNSNVLSQPTNYLKKNVYLNMWVNVHRTIEDTAIIVIQLLIINY